MGSLEGALPTAGLGKGTSLTARSWPTAVGLPAPGSFQQPQPLPPLLRWLLQRCTGLGLFFFSCFCSHELCFVCVFFFVGSKRQRVPVGGGTSTSPGVLGGEPGVRCLRLLPISYAFMDWQLRRPCRVGRNQSYLLPSLLAAAVNSATEEKVKHFCFPSDPSLSTVPRHVSRCPRDLASSQPPLRALFFFRASTGLPTG